MAFELVGVQLDQTGNDIIAIHVITTIGVAPINRCNFAIADQNRPRDNLVSKHDASIFKNDFVSHWIALS